MSKPIHPSGMALLAVVLVCASLANLSAIFESTGKYNFTPLALAFSINSRVSAMRSSSHRELPMVPPWAFINVYDMPPPIKILSAMLSRFSMMSNLSETFAPPTIAVKGRSDFFITFSALATSWAIT